MGDNQDPEHISESLETIFWVKILTFLRIRDGKFKSGMNIPDPQHYLLPHLRSLASEVLATLQFILLMGMGRRGTSSISVHELLILFSFDNKDTFCSLTPTTKKRFIFGGQLPKKRENLEINYKRNA
jgi:hypothetical protein